MNMDKVSLDIRKWLTEILKTSFQIEKHSYSNQDDVYRIRTSNECFYLKVSTSLKKEYENLIKLKTYLKVPDVIDFRSIGNKDHLLLSDVKGNNLAELVGEYENTVIVREFARAVKQFHSLNINELYSGEHNDGDVVLHSDMSMPNVIFAEPGSVGYIDLAQMTTGKAETDLADAIWSLQRNIGPGYGELFLQEYGDVTITEKIDNALKFKFPT